MTSGRKEEAMWDDLSTVPAVFTLEMLVFLPDDRKKKIKTTLEYEAEELEQSAKKYAEDKEELLQILNLLTWLEFKIGSKEKALELNNKALALTKNNECFSLGNRAHLMWCHGDLEQTRSCLESLANVKVNGSSGKDLAIVKANQAYCYFRLGGRENLSQAVTLYEEALEEMPASHLWRLQAGIANKRLSHPNMQKKSMPDDANDRRKMRKHAKENLGHVGDKSTNPRLRAYAYSELAQLVLDYKVRDLCDKALEILPDSYVTSVNCSKALKRIREGPQVLKILEKIHDERSSTESLEVIGDHFQKMAIVEKNESVQKDLYDKAEDNYREALRQNSTNLSAHFSLAKLLATRRNYREALVEFREFFNTVRSVGETSYALLQMKAYEQAALCKLELCHDQAYIGELPHPVTEESKNAGDMLLKVLVIGFNILRPEEAKKYLEEPLDTLVELEKERNTPEALKLSRVLQLVNEKKETLQVLKSLLDVMSQDPGHIISEINSHINVKSYDEAYALVQMSRVKLEPCNFDWDLFTRVTLLAAWKHLGQLTSQTAAARIFKDQFDNHRLRDRYSNPPTQPSEVDEVTKHLDVLIIYDDSRDGSKGESELSKLCSKLQEAMTTVFGLNVSHNLQAFFAGGPLVALNSKEMNKAQVVLVVIDEEPMDKYFSSLLNYLPNVMEQREDNPRPPRVLVAQTNARVKVPSAISSFPKVPFIESTMVSFETLKQMCKPGEAISSSGDPKPADDTARKCVEEALGQMCDRGEAISSSKDPELADDTARKCVEEALGQMCDRVEAISSSGDPELVDDTARKCFEDIMVFFCSLISTDWPLSQTVAV